MPYEKWGEATAQQGDPGSSIRILQFAFFILHSAGGHQVCSSRAIVSPDAQKKRKGRPLPFRFVSPG